MRKLTPEERRALVEAPISINYFNYHGLIHDKDRATAMPITEVLPKHIEEWTVRQLIFGIIDVRYKQNRVWVYDNTHPKGGYLIDTSPFSAVELLAQLEKRTLTEEEKAMVQKMRGHAWWRPRRKA